MNGDRSGRPSAAVVAAVVAVVVGAVWALVAGLPLLSESHTQLEVVADFRGPLDAFDPTLVPFRPLQHLTFHVLDVGFGADAAVGRALTFGMHALSALLVFGIARRLGATSAGAWVALGLFLAFPSAKGLTWVAAVSGPGRTLCLLVVVRATVELAAGRSARAGAALVAAFVVGLAFHQSAIVAPAIVVLGLGMLEDGGVRARAAAVLRGLARPAGVVLILVAVGYAVYVGTLRSERHHGFVQAGAVAANVCKASLALAPEAIRVPALDGLRGGGGTAGFVLGLAAVAAVALAFGLGFWRGGGAVRWLLLLVPLDLALPVLTTGFVGRYAHFAAAVTAVALGLGFGSPGRGGGRLARAAIVALGACWAVDHAVDVVEVRRAGAGAERLLDDAAAARAAAPVGRRIALVDAPDHAGAEDDVPVWNWGLAQALARRGAAGPWLLLRVDPCWTTSDHRTVTEAELAAIAADGAVDVLRFDPVRGGFAAWPPPGR